LIEVDRLGSRVWVIAGFQMFALTAGEMSQVGREIVRGGGLSGGNMSEGEMSNTLVRVTCMTQKL